MSAVTVPPRASAIAHTGLDICNPLSGSALSAAVAALGPLDGARVLDVGCGKGDLLARLLSAGASVAAGVDLSSAHLAVARERLGTRAVLVEADASSYDFGPPYDVVCCVGSSHALGSWDRLRALARPSGRLLVGEGFWRRTPDPAYLAALGATEDELLPLEGLRALLRPDWETVASAEDWERYESAWAGNLRRYAGAHPEDPEAPALRALGDAGWDRYACWGRDTLGFALMVSAASG
jgi:SAM-dependent methyltransferase